MVKSMRLKKAPKVAKTPPSLPIKIRVGTRNELGPERQFATEVAAKEAIIKEFNEWKPWCQRYHNAGVDAIRASCAEASDLVFHREPSRIECVFDPYSGMHVAVEFWRSL
jgi:hypothetical protein